MKRYAFWIEVVCPVCREVIVNYAFTLQELVDEVAVTVREHETSCKEKHESNPTAKA